MPTLAILFAAAQTVAAPAPLSSRECVAVELVTPRETRTAPGERTGPVERQAPARATRGLPTVSAARTVDVQLRVRIRPVVSGDHLLHLKLFTPGGYLYQTMTLPFRFEQSVTGTTAAGPPATRHVAGFPRPLAVQRLSAPGRGRGGVDRVTARLPVAGTSIALGSLFGRWTAVPYLDDRAAPCGPAGSFVITE